ncbi:tetrahydromethanopterin S-methyltransferase, subunit B [Methanothermus fervidus DSM 2088]|uniref:Tetrahydromethanopterin S-methyltransferase subunit B n=1 Tax=Methanothermus fervidus (strain ATCC 43054 / DSM 2088 / JCM 10308 / V24 S) TaxID=523846 RepID=E3GZ47_METFV|nr:tetrahydromethanopterin S-methyltransferase subunit B [Methanothermus fervidus]ADP77579.1 tetrahydromethanopterin S-methyltransferase, subunit B [Methanothermus fervidus DSM 2088]
MEMLPFIHVAPEFNLALDPSAGVISTALGRDVIVLSMDDLNKELDKLEVAVDNLYNSLDPNTIPPESYPGREGIYITQGKITNMIYGFVFGLIVFALILLKFGGV